MNNTGRNDHSGLSDPAQDRISAAVTRANDRDLEALIFCLRHSPVETLKSTIGRAGAWRDYVRLRSPGGAARTEEGFWPSAADPHSISACGGGEAPPVSKDLREDDAQASGLDWRTLLRLMRAHQWAKNLLLFVPMLTGRRLDVETVWHVLLGAVAFSLCASAVYIFNDLLDLDSDRRHPTKKMRPLASGRCRIQTALALAPVLLAGSLALAALVSSPFALAIVCYFCLTSAYSLKLKSKLIVDVIVLASLYTGRIIAGGIAADVAVSHWLLAFSMFIFTALALMKRYVELALLAAHDLPESKSRNYRAGDLTVIAALAAATSMNAVTIFALYIFGGTEVPYTRPWALWLICPLLLYWLARALVMAHRLDMNDDPVLFALHDRTSRLTLLSIIALVAIAI